MCLLSEILVSVKPWLGEKDYGNKNIWDDR